DLRKIREASGEPIMGFLGMDFLGRYVVRIDPDRGEVLFLKSVPEDAGVPFPMPWSPDTIPEVTAEVGDSNAVRFMVHPAEASRGLKKGGHADPIWSCVKGLQVRRSACPPACCITASASGAISTSALSTKAAKSCSPSGKSPRPAGVRRAARG